MQESNASPYLTVKNKHMKVYLDSKKRPLNLNKTQVIISKKPQNRCISINFDFQTKFEYNNHDKSKKSLEINNKTLQYTDRLTFSNFPESHKYNSINRMEVNKPKILRTKVNHYNSEFSNPNTYTNLSSTNKKEKILSIFSNNENFQTFKIKFLPKEKEKLQTDILNSDYTSPFHQNKKETIGKSKIFHPQFDKCFIAKKCSNPSSQESSNIKRKNSLHDHINFKLFVTEEKEKKWIENKEEDTFNKKITFNPSGNSFFPKLSQKIFNYKLLKMPFGKHKIIPNQGTQTKIFRTLKMNPKKKKNKPEEVELDLFYKQ